MPDHSTAFPPDFLWGAATSAYQIEGSPLADGAGPSIWHEFAHTPGRTRDGDTGDLACDHYRRYRDDVALMGGLGLNAYRFSVSWSRVVPEGRGRVNPQGLDFYQRLVDALLEQGIQPMLTLYHWDLPATLDRRGGWLNPDSAGWFADYAQVLFRALDDRVRLWVTLNEPWVVVDGGYLHGVLAPGLRNPFAAPHAAHNLLRAHAAATQAYRAVGRHRIGLVVNLEPKYPATETAEDLAATMRADAYWNRQYLDPVFLGSYPPELAEIFGTAWPAFAAADLDALRQPPDFLGINYYSRQVVRHDPRDWPLAAARVRQARQTHTGLDWEVYPQGLTDILQWVAGRYGPLPLYITENGAAFYDPPQADGAVDDPLRRRYLHDHLRAARVALATGVDLRGYFAWSLLDNFEWAHGYSQRFGLIHVDYATQRRTVKASGKWYAEIVRGRGAMLCASETGEI
ncbi:beta-glucosidase [Candidatus Competibacter phosphatis]|uniref:Beta-glucosidase n=1 Tax=Candidatus Competibacter phosphatis TaxID=221280 RepID=A0ABX1TGF5_9GAMM|nr:GH1 family beta-glucosidase [Candidatus Competibacter phosphatis]NMQ18460.1 beta-glucosidase [Candidatus Competibacter phosphatis]